MEGRQYVDSAKKIEFNIEYHLEYMIAKMKGLGNDTKNINIKYQ